MIQGVNYAGVTPIPASPDDTEYVHCNFSKKSPKKVAGEVVGHKLWPRSKKNITFRDCNLVNCEPPKNAILVGCNTAIVEPNIIIGKRIMEIEGNLREFNRVKHVFHGRWNQNTKEYDRPENPIESLHGLPEPRVDRIVEDT
jgi:hypothetical protein